MTPRADTPRVDVIIPAYRPHPAMLAEAIASAAASPLVARIIIIDDGSDPPVTLSVTSELGTESNPTGAARSGSLSRAPRERAGERATPPTAPSEPPRATSSGSTGASPSAHPPLHAAPPIDILRQRNAGPAAARNRGLRAATAEWVLMLDDDDLLIPEGLAAAIELAEQLKAVGALAARIERTEGEPDRPKPAPPEWAGKPLPSPGAVFRPTVLFNGSGILLRREPGGPLGGPTLRGGSPGGPKLRGGSPGGPKLRGGSGESTASAATLRFHQGLFVVEDREFLRRLAGHGPIAISGDPMIITRRRPDGSNLTGGRHLRRRIRGHVLLLRKYLDQDSAPWLRAQTTWLLNTAAKSGIDAAHWRLLTRAARDAGWRVPLKAQLRQRLRG